MSASGSHLHDQARDWNNALEKSQVLDQLARVLTSEPFKRSPRSAAFLKFVVEQALSGRSDFIKGRAIAMAVFDRREDENPEEDAIVRIQAGRVRKRLSQYYEEQGANDPLRISIPKGSYIPVFECLKTCEETKGVAPCKVGEIIMEGAREEAAQIWKSD